MEFFISSTVYELPDERNAVSEVLTTLKQVVSRSEFFVATAETPIEVCLRKANSCDIFIGIYKDSYGFIPQEDNPEGKSVIEMEYDAAKEKRKLIFIHADDTGRNDRLKALLKRVTNFTYGKFRKLYQNSFDLKYQLLVSLIFEIFHLDRNLSQSERSNLISLAEDEFHYQGYLLNRLRYIDFKGMPKERSFVTLEQQKLFVEPSLVYWDKNKDIKSDTALVQVQPGHVKNILKNLSMIF